MCSVTFSYGHDCQKSSQKSDFSKKFLSFFESNMAVLLTRLPLGQRGARQRIDCTANLLLTFVWDETASGTARSKNSTKARSRSAVQSINVEKEKTVYSFLLSQGQSCHIQQRGADQLQIFSCSSLSQRQSCPITKARRIRSIQS